MIKFITVRKLKPLLSLSITTLILISCVKEELKPIGQWDDIIKLSTKNATLKAESDSVLLTTDGSWWWINSITLEDSTYSYYNSTQINMEASSYSIDESDFKIEKRDKTNLFIKLNRNTTDKERVLKIVLQAGNYFDYVSIKQHSLK